MDGLSLRVIARKFYVSKESVRLWMLKFEEAFARKKLARKKERDIILLDETEVKRNGRMLIWTPFFRHAFDSFSCMISFSIF